MRCMAKDTTREAIARQDDDVAALLDTAAWETRVAEARARREQALAGRPGQPHDSVPAAAAAQPVVLRAAPLRPIAPPRPTDPAAAGFPVAERPAKPQPVPQVVALRPKAAPLRPTAPVQPPAATPSLLGPQAAARPARTGSRLAAVFLAGLGIGLGLALALPGPLQDRALELIATAAPEPPSAAPVGQVAPDAAPAGLDGAALQAPFVPAAGGVAPPLPPSAARQTAISASRTVPPAPRPEPDPARVVTTLAQPIAPEAIAPEIIASDTVDPAAVEPVTVDPETVAPEAPAPTVAAVEPAPEPIAEPAPDPVSDPGQTRVFVHAPSDVSETEAEAMMAAIRAAGFTAIGPIRVGFAISASNARFYHPQDAAAAQAIADLLPPEVVGPMRTRDFTDFTPPPLPGIVELWIAGAPSGGAPAPETAPEPAPAPIAGVVDPDVLRSLVEAAGR